MVVSRPDRRQEGTVASFPPEFEVPAVELPFVLLAYQILDEFVSGLAGEYETDYRPNYIGVLGQPVAAVNAGRLSLYYSLQPLGDGQRHLRQIYDVLHMQLIVDLHVGEQGVYVELPLLILRDCSLAQHHCQ